jgi:DNA-binding response OmpR family regulator
MRALTILANERIEAVSLDIRIPDPKGLQRTGLSVLAHLRSIEEYGSVPVLVFTARLSRPVMNSSCGVTMRGCFTNRSRTPW